MMFTQLTIIIAAVVAVALLWKIVTKTIKMIMAVAIALVIAYFLIVNLVPGFGHLNFLRSIFQ